MSNEKASLRTSQRHHGHCRYSNTQSDEKDLGVTIDNKLNFRKLIANKVLYSKLELSIIFRI